MHPNSTLNLGLRCSSRRRPLLGTEIWSGDLVGVEETIIKISCFLSAGDELFLAGDAYDTVAEALLQECLCFGYNRIDA